MPIIEPPPEGDAPPAPLRERLAWFALLWPLGAAVVGAIAWAMRALLF
ncbi:DUF2474 domain-containing protein [Sandaracinobacteroides saxicola]|uniref:DUF2474 domain-containing protein n=1 Tax=Sandaracinobacteroides saxicola TaxID=2759707 RepID=A0A7G5IKX8_9SPHN|nr:DUF2474 domain-containing protein [Sandaracinobacteroides saxicola]QMW24020.1 DUF2474 domain-containing protein [Sandaracinobacteroides saxicola]